MFVVIQCWHNGRLDEKNCFSKFCQFGAGARETRQTCFTCNKKETRSPPPPKYPLPISNITPVGQYFARIMCCVHTVCLVPRQEGLVLFAQSQLVETVTPYPPPTPLLTPGQFTSRHWPLFVFVFLLPPRFRCFCLLPVLRCDG